MLQVIASSIDSEDLVEGASRYGEALRTHALSAGRHAPHHEGRSPSRTVWFGHTCGVVDATAVSTQVWHCGPPSSCMEDKMGAVDAGCLV